MPLSPHEWATANLVSVASEVSDGGDLPISVGSGIGIPIASDGLILTSASAVVGANRINVWLPGAEFPVEATLQAESACSNLALITIDEELDPVVDIGPDGRPAHVVWFDGEALRDASFASDGTYPPGAVIVGEDGTVTGMWNAIDPQLPLISAGQVTPIVEAMRRRDVVAELGMVVHDGGDGSLTVVAVDPAHRPEFLVGDSIINVEGEPASLSSLCGSVIRFPVPVEVLREGRRHIGETDGSPLELASARSQEQIRQAVGRVDNDRDGDGVIDVTGSGFLISEDGQMVTNHHLITGMESTGDIAVRIDGGDPIPATIMGRSSCHDLALLDLAGSGYTYLEWSPSPIELEMAVRSVGFPAGTPTITFQAGQVSKELATVYPSSPLPDHFEHSAQVFGGNSGGPMLNEIGEVVGVTVSEANFDEGDDEEYAIVASAARDVVAELEEGDFDHTGLYLTYGPFPSVSAIDPGGPGELAGFEPGDRIFRWGGLGFDDMTLRDMCREYIEGVDSGSLQVALFRGDEEYDGDFFGSITEVPDPFHVEDPSGLVGSFVPGRWTDVRAIAPDDANDWVGFRAAPDVDRFLDESFGVNPGTRILVSANETELFTTDEKMGSLDYGGCTDLGVEPVTPVLGLVGHVRTYVDCRGTDSGIRAYALLDKSQPSPVMVLVLITANSTEMGWIEGLIFETLEVGEWVGDAVTDG